MRAIILAAGRGSRLGAHTETQPKCLVELAGKPLLHWQHDALRAAGVAQIAIVRGYRAESLPTYFDAVFDNPQWSRTNMVATLRCAAAWLAAEPCLVAYSDIVYRPAIVRALIRAEGPLAITYDRCWQALWGARFADPLSDAENFRLTPTGELGEIGGRATSLDAVEGQYMGLLKFTPEGWHATEAWLAQRSAAEQERMDMTSLLGGLLKAGTRIAAVPVSGGWCEVDSAEDLSLYEARLGASPRWSHDWREAEATA
jgi:choline kinase